MIVFIGACAQTCTVPNVETGSLDVAGDPAQVSDAGVLYFYTNPFGTLECNGAVTGFEYCEENEGSGPKVTAFSLLVFRKSNDQNYTVILSQNEEELRGGCSNNLCCDGVVLEGQKHFATSSDISFALLVYSEAPLLYVSAMSDGYAIDPSPFSIGNVPSEGTVLTRQDLNLAIGENPVAINLRSFRFIICKSKLIDAV